MGDIHWSNIIISMIFGALGGVISIWAKHYLYKVVGKISVETNEIKLVFYQETAYGDQEETIIDSNNKISNDLMEKFNSGQIILDLDLINNSQINKIMRDIYLEVGKTKFDLKNLKTEKVVAGCLRSEKIANISLPPQEIKNINAKSYIKEDMLKKIYECSYAYLKWKNKKGKQFKKKIRFK
jgi:hypothetical protein